MHNVVESSSTIMSISIALLAISDRMIPVVARTLIREADRES